MAGTGSLASALAGTEGVRILRRPVEADGEIPFGQSEPQAVDAPLVEGWGFAPKAVASAPESLLTHFSDGAQIARQAFYHGSLPGYLAFVNAAVLSRTDGEMLHSEGRYAERLAVFAPAGTLALRLLADAGFDVCEVDADPGLGMSGVAERVRAEISEERQRLEADVVASWLDSGTEGWLLVDGGVGAACRRSDKFMRLVGVVKSHRRQYFREPERVAVVLGLAPGERTPAFLAESMPGHRAYSWYLRLRDDPGEPPAFGLVRVELPPQEESLDWVDAVSGWLLAERAPLSLPDPRFDRLIYPVRRVELYLRSRQPSEAALWGLIGA